MSAPNFFDDETPNFFEEDEEVNFFEEEKKELSFIEKVGKELRLAEEQRVGGGLIKNLEMVKDIGKEFRIAEEKRVGSDILKLTESDEFNSLMMDIFSHEGHRLQKEAVMGLKHGRSATKHFLNNITFNNTARLLEDLPDEDPAAALLGEVAAEAVFWGTGFKLAKPIIQAAKATYGIAGGVIARLLSVEALGLGKQAISTKIGTGELPSQEEVLEHAKELALIDLGFQSLELIAEFHMAMRSIGAAEGISTWETYKNLAKSIKNFGTEAFEALSPTGKVEVVKDILEKPSPELEAPEIDVTPEVKKPSKVPKKPIESSTQLTEIENIRDEIKADEQSNVFWKERIEGLKQKGAKKEDLDIIETTIKQNDRNIELLNRALAKEIKKEKPPAEPPKKPPKKPPAPPAAEPPEEPSKPKQPADIKTQEVVKKHIPTKSTVDQTARMAAEEPQELYTPPLFGDARQKASKLSNLLDRLPRVLKPRSDLAKKTWELRQDYFGKKWGLDMRYRQKWDKILREKKITSDNLEDMIFYLEDPEILGRSRELAGTGNPFKGINDSWGDVSRRLSPEAKAASKDIRKHFQDVLKMLNESPYVKNINPREFLEHIYVPHFYDGNVSKALNEVLSQKRFSTTNPLANMRKYITFNDALREAGLIPKYRNINDLLNHYDALTTRVLINSELAGELKDLEKSLGQKLIARPNNKKLYQQAKSEGWVEFSDPYLRRRLVGKDAKGRPLFATSEANALVHPDLADALKGIFVKDAYKPENIVFRGMDWYNDQVRALRVQFWPMFHLGALTESLLGAQGLKGIKNLFRDWNTIFSDPEFNEFAAASGLKFGIPTDTAMRDSRVMFEGLLNKLELEGGKVGALAKEARKLFKLAAVPSQILFNEIHPRMKMSTFADYLARVERKALKKGIPMTPEWRKQAGRDIAEIVNDQFGGQAWEFSRVFGDPKNLKRGKRILSYLDWTVSALKQFLAIFEDIPQMLRGQGASTKGGAARRYNLRYVAYVTAFSQIMSYLYTGMTNEKDKKGKPIPNKIIWDYSKAHSTFQNKDPKHSGYLSQFFHYQLPDVVYEAAGVEFNPGRDEKGRRRYSHAGKQFLELAKYVTNFTGQVFAKSSPFIQFIIPYFMDKTPGEGDWKTRGVWEGGKTVPWDGTDPWTLERTESYLKFTGEQFIPFFAKSIYENPAAFPFVFFGTFPVSKGISLTGSSGYFDTYYRVLENPGYSPEAKKEADRRVRELTKVLLDQKYTPTQINRKKNAAKKKVKPSQEKD